MSDKKILVSGSIANDYIMNFHDQFGRYILPEKTHQLSVSFNISELHAFAGWTGANIAYNLALLDQESVLLGAVGKEFVFADFMQQWVDMQYTVISESLHTAVANIMTDEKNNQITAFYPGAIAESWKQSIPDIDISYAIVSPNAPETMVMHVQQCAEKRIPVFFDPGQPLPAFSKEQLLTTLEAATYLIVNEYELDLLCIMTDLKEKTLLDYVDAYIVTLGAWWSSYVSKQESFSVDAVFVEYVVDPTWAGDAYRAGLLYALYHGQWRKAGMELWSQLAAACVQMHGTQRHEFSSWNN